MIILSNMSNMSYKCLREVIVNITADRGSDCCVVKMCSQFVITHNIVENEDKNVSVVVILPLEYVISNSIS